MKKRMPLLRGAIALVAATAAATGAGAQEDPFTQLKHIDPQARGPVVAIRTQIQRSLGEPTKLASIEQGLLGVLNDSNATLAGKQEACRLLWPISTVRSVPVLAGMLVNPDPKLSDAARYALERDPDPAVGQTLLSLLKRAQGAQAVGIINTLGDRAEASAVPSLIPFTAGSDSVAGEAAIAALGKIGTRDALAILRGLPPSPTVEAALLKTAGRLASSGEKGKATAVYRDLARPDRSFTLQIAALRGLAALDPAEAAPLVLTDLQSPDGSVQIAAANLLPALPDGHMRKQGLALAASLPAPAQAVVLAGFAARHDKDASALAEQAVASSDATVRSVAIPAVATLEGAKAVPLLARVAAQGTPPDRQTARTALAQLPGKDAEQAILKLAREGEEPVRVALVGVLADRGTSDAHAQLLIAARGTDDKQAVDALKALGRSATQDEYPTLVAVLTGARSPMVRDAAQGAVVASARRIGDANGAATPLAAALPGASTDLRASLLEALAEIGGDQALTELTKATSASNADVKQAAVQALAETWTDPRALPALLNIARTDTDKSYRVQALRGYLRLLGSADRMRPEEKVQHIREALQVAERPEEKRQAFGILRDCRVPGAITTVSPYLDDPAVFNEAADAVLYLAAPQKKGNANLTAVKGPETGAALDKVARLAKEDSVRDAALKLK